MCDCHVDYVERRPAPSLSRRVMLAGGLAAGITPLLPSLTTRVGATLLPSPDTKDFSFLPPRPASERYVRPMMFPVLADPTLGRATWTDSYLAPRSGGRRHEGQDLIGKKMLKLLACVDATVVELRHEASGNSLYLRGDDGWYYCYLHINNDTPGTDDAKNPFAYAFAPGMAVGKQVLKGEHVAFLGDSGNAELTVSHCHFEIRMPNAHWYNAAAVQASYSLTAAAPAALRATVAPTAFRPFDGATAFARQQAIDFLGAAPSGAWLSSATSRLEDATIGLDAFIEAMLGEVDQMDVTQPLVRLYLGFFPSRIADFNGVSYWQSRLRRGMAIDAVASQLAGSSEFIERYGSLGNSAYVTQLYANLFGRRPDAGGLDYWTRRLDGGAKRGWVMRQLCESSEFQGKSRSRVRVTAVYLAMLRRAPDRSGYAYWSAKVAASSTGLQALIASIRTGTAYAQRF